MKILKTKESLQIISDTIDKGKGCFFTRFGDNDVMMMSGTDTNGNPLAEKKYGGNKTKWSPSLQKELRESFSINDDIFLKGLSGAYETEEGMYDGVFKSFGYSEALLSKARCFTEQKEFLNPVMFQYLVTFHPNVIKEFVNKHIKGKNILFISGTPVEWGEYILGEIKYYVKSPSKTAYDKIDEWYRGVEEIISERNVDVVIPNCGQCSRVIQKRLYKGGYRGISIDMGSVFDCWGNFPITRTWIRKEGHKVRSNF